jgi:hypothetical protein
VSIYGNPPHVVTVYPVVEVDDGYGGTQPGEGEPVTVRCLVQPRVTESLDGAEGYLSASVLDVAARSLPAGAWSRVTYNDEDYTVVSEPLRYGVSRRTAHDVATIRRR